jgi:hypothetical protein
MPPKASRGAGRALAIASPTTGDDGRSCGNGDGHGATSSGCNSDDAT